VVRLVTRSALVSTVAGLTVGLVGAAVAASVARTLVFELEPFRPSAYASTAVLTLGVAALGLWWPASRAVKIAPAQTLRAE
jgi:putative ABC transport system permease protein